jgi:O-antigen/teichoic acid export membrane protein
VEPRVKSLLDRWGVWTLQRRTDKEERRRLAQVAESIQGLARGHPGAVASTEAGEGAFGTTRRVAAGALMRSVGEVVSKLASIAFYVAIARELGDASFGDFIFGLSLSQVVLLIAGFGTEELISRDVARDERLVQEMFRDVLAVKALLLFGLWLVIAGILAIGGYPLETAIAVMLIGAGVGIEYQAKTYYALFQAREKMQYIAASMVAQRTATSLVGIAVLLAGGDLIAVSAVFVAGALLGLLSAHRWMPRVTARPRGPLDRSRWRPLLRAAAPLGLVSILYLALIRLDAALISFLTGGDNSAVGHYGAGYRLVDATMFLSLSFGGAIMPWFSRHGPESPVSLGRAYELGLKAMIALLVPIGMLYGLFAEPLIETLYGPDFDDAVGPLRFLAAMTVLFGITTFVSIVLIARDRPREFIRPAAIVLIQNLAFNLILIPRYGASGAAFNAVLSGVLLVALTVPPTAASFGGVSPVRVLASPLTAAAAMTAVALLLGDAPWALAAAASGVAYLLVFVGVERAAFPGDYGFIAGAVRRREATAPAA